MYYMSIRLNNMVSIARLTIHDHTHVHDKYHQNGRSLNLYAPPVPNGFLSKWSVSLIPLNRLKTLPLWTNYNAYIQLVCGSIHQKFMKENFVKCMAGCCTLLYTLIMWLQFSSTLSHKRNATFLCGFFLGPKVRVMWPRVMRNCYLEQLFVEMMYAPISIGIHSSPKERQLQKCCDSFETECISYGACMH